MFNWLRNLDETLRGRKIDVRQLAEGRLDISLSQFLPIALVLGAIYGSFMGWYGLSTGSPDRWKQILASMAKLPVLFLATLLVTFPSLYVFNALVGCQLRFVVTLKLLIAIMVVNLALAASLGPILGFFTLSTDSYSFMVLLNVVLLALAGLVSLGVLLGLLRRLAALQQWRSYLADQPEPIDPRMAAAEGASQPASSRPPPMPPPDGGHGPAHSIFRVWIMIYALVGAQMSWILRPFIGHPKLPFEWFRPRSGNFFVSVVDSLQALFSSR